MARERTVTRTIKTTVLEIMGVDIETAEVIKTEFNVPSYSGTPKEQERIKAQYETPTFKVVNMTVVGTEENLYSMAESTFIQLAEKLPPRGETQSDNQ